jgi:hypothetical protein
MPYHKHQRKMAALHYICTYASDDSVNLLHHHRKLPTAHYIPAGVSSHQPYNQMPYYTQINADFLLCAQSCSFTVLW